MHACGSDHLEPSSTMPARPTIAASPTTDAGKSWQAHQASPSEASSLSPSSASWRALSVRPQRRHVASILRAGQKCESLRAMEESSADATEQKPGETIEDPKGETS